MKIRIIIIILIVSINTVTLVFSAPETKIMTVKQPYQKNIANIKLLSDKIDNLHKQFNSSNKINKRKILDLAKKISDEMDQAQARTNQMREKKISALKDGLKILNDELSALKTHHDNSDWLKLFWTLFMGLAGAIIGGLFALRGANNSHQYELKRLEQYEEQKIRNFLQAIRCELQLISDMYMKSIGLMLEQSKEDVFRAIYPVDQDYFTVYQNNSSLLGGIHNEHLREDIIKNVYVGKVSNRYISNE